MDNQTHPDQTLSAHYMKPDEDCMGNPTRGYWRCFGHCSDGTCVGGTGETEDAAILEAAQRVQEREKYLALPDADKLKVLINNSEFSGADQRDATLILGRLVLILCDRFGSEPR